MKIKKISNKWLRKNTIPVLAKKSYLLLAYLINLISPSSSGSLNTCFSMYFYFSFYASYSSEMSNDYLFISLIIKKQINKKYL